MSRNNTLIIESAIDNLYSNLFSYKKILVGFSGGLDSTVLLHSIFSYIKKREIDVNLRAIHINHNLDPSSDEWQKHCEIFCKNLNIDISCYKSNLHKDKGNLENLAREFRYDCFKKEMIDFDNDSLSTVLLLAHHANDQAETLLMRLFRGSGTKGVASIPKKRELDNSKYYLYRPFLDLSKDLLVEYSRENNLDFIDDPSNKDISYDRNFIRSKLIPIILKRWPNYNKNFLRFVSNSRNDMDLLNELALIDLKTLEPSKELFGYSLNLKLLKVLSSKRRSNVIRYWLCQFLKYQPTHKQLMNIDELIDMESDACELFIGSCRLNKYKDRLYLNNHLQLAELKSFLTTKNKWKLTEKFSLPYFGELIFISKDLNQKKLILSVSSRIPGQKYSVRGMNRSINKLFNESQIPSWFRDFYPIIYNGNDIIAVPNILVADNTDNLSKDQFSWRTP